MKDKVFTDHKELAKDMKEWARGHVARHVELEAKGPANFTEDDWKYLAEGTNHSVEELKKKYL